MNEARKRMLERVKAILAKTMANGCTEGEAMAALAKAQDLMAAYDISEADLGHTEETESATVHKDYRADPYGIKRELAAAVGRFTRCKGWRGAKGGSYSHGFCGLESDVPFATWLLDTLTAFVLRELKSHQSMRRTRGQPNPRIVSSSFVFGCTLRIANRLDELTPKETDATTGNALVVSRKAIIRSAMHAAGISLRKHNAGKRYVHNGSFEAGTAAGNAARFDRPVSGANAGPLRLT
jgi:hypothetical protein